MSDSTRFTGIGRDPSSMRSSKDGCRGRQVSVVIPTFNEAGNIDELLGRLTGALAPQLNAEVIFVDDSTDDTPMVIADVARRHDVHVVLVRRVDPRGGLGGAVVEGLRVAQAPWAVVMDADLQHPPSLVPALLAAGETDGADLVVATRYSNGGSRVGLGSWYRETVSTGASKLARIVLGGPVAKMSDPLSGFFAVRISALRLSEARPLGYKVLLELIVRSDLTRITERPYEFGPRFAGSSKSTPREGVRYLRHLLALRRALREDVRWCPDRVSPAHVSETGLAAADDVRAPDVPAPRPALVGLHGNSTGARRLHILVLTSEAPPIVSGISRCVDRLSAGLAARGHRVDVISSVQIPRLQVGEWRLSSLLAHWPSIARDFGRYDLVNLHGPVPTMSDVVLGLTALLPAESAPIVYTHHSSLEIRGLERLCGLYNKLHRLLTRRARLIMTTSQHYGDLLQMPRGPAVQVVPWGVDLRPEPARSRDDHKPLQVLFVGQMRTYKGVEWLLSALVGRPEIELTLVGSGPHLADYQRLAQSLGGGNVRFLGHISDEALHEEYDRSDVVTLPSVTTAEAFGLVVLEGMAAGCVPVVSDLPGVRDLVSGIGIIVPPRDAAALRSAVLELAAGRDRLHALRSDARRRAEGMSWDTCVARYEKAFYDAAHTAGREQQRPHQAPRPRLRRGENLVPWQRGSRSSAAQLPARRPAAAGGVAAPATPGAAVLYLEDRGTDARSRA